MIFTIGILWCVIGNSTAVPVETKLLSPGSGGASTPDENICRTKGCIETANTFLKNMDRNVDPCDNFYKFACGNMINSTIVPGDKRLVNTFGLLQDKLEEQLRTIIEAPIQPNEIKPFRLAKNFYNTCMNVEKIEAQGLQPFRNMLKKLGGWPVVDGEESQNNFFEWKNAISPILDVAFGNYYFMSLYVSSDLRNSTKNAIHIGYPQFSLDPDYLSQGFNDTVVQEHYNLMVDVAVIFGADRHRAETEIEEVLRFEIALGNMTKVFTDGEDVNQYYNPMTVSELKKNYSRIPWDEYFNKLSPANETITDNEVVIVVHPDYIAGLENLMATTPKRVQANYLMWLIVASTDSYLNEAVRERIHKYTTVLQGVTERKPRWKECLEIVSDRLSISVGAMYARNYFDKEAKDNAAMTFTNIKEQFKKSLQQVDWMDDTTRQRALGKLAAMSSFIAFSDELFDDHKLEEYYSNLDLSVGNFLESFFNITVFHNRQTFKDLHKVRTKNDWTARDSTAINAYYFDDTNSIVLPAGILQSIFFTNDRPKYTNYGAIGSIVGHEITHGFDVTGSQYDKDGNAMDWWAQSTKERFANRTKCMVHQYGNYTVEEIGRNLNGEQGLNENIADNGGIKAAYSAYVDWAARNAPEPKLPGLAYTPKQMFWMSTANVWCTKYTKSKLTEISTMGKHSPSEFRIVGPLSNIPDFSNDFNCPIGSGMNPVKKCSVW